MCRKNEMTEQPLISYWPRDARLRPYCAGDEDHHNCSVHSYWESNPESRERIRDAKWPDSTIIPGALTLVSGQFLVWTSAGLVSIIGSAGSIIGAYHLANGLSRRYTGKEFFRWLKTRKDIRATDEIYQRVLERLDKSEETEASVEDMFGMAGPIDNMVHKISDVQSPTLTVSGARDAEWRKAVFKTGRLHASYMLTEDFAISSETDMGVCISYKYEKRMCDNPKCDSTKTSYYVTGILDPVIHAGRVRKNGPAFIESTMHKPMMSLPFPVMDEEQGMRVRTMTPVASEIIAEMGKIGEFFGSQRKFDSMARACMDEETTMDARNIHRLMQDVLYSEF